MMQIAALLKQYDYTCEALDLAMEDNWEVAIHAHQPQLLAFSATTGLHRRLARVSCTIKNNMNVLSIFGGPHPTCSPQFIERAGVDIICRGEGEYPMLELVEALEKGKDFTAIPNLWVKLNGQIYRNSPRPYLSDLDSLPWPDRDLFDMFPQLHQGDTRYFMAGRGCPYDCAFCFNQVGRKLAEGRYVRWRSVENLIGELKAVKENYGMRFVRFQDDTFVLRMQWLEKFCALYRQEIGLPFFCTARVDLVTDRMSKILAEAGCVNVALGVESGNDRVRNMVLKKNISKNQIIYACRSLQSHGIAVLTLNMFGLPFDKIDTALETIELNIACQPRKAGITCYMPYPGTQLAQISIDEGLFDAGDYDSLPEQLLPWSSLIVLDLEEGQQLEQLARLFNFCVRFPVFYPLIRFLFKCKGGNWIKAFFTTSWGLMQLAYTKIIELMFSRKSG
jgi:radical SAM superfamily enzyme YgiQ (UPF0313 family)